MKFDGDRPLLVDFIDGDEMVRGVVVRIGRDEITVRVVDGEGRNHMKRLWHGDYSEV